METTNGRDRGGAGFRKERTSEIRKEELIGKGNTKDSMKKTKGMLKT